MVKIGVNVKSDKYLKIEEVSLTRHSTSLGVQRVLFFLCVHTLLTVVESHQEKSFRRLSSPKQKLHVSCPFISVHLSIPYYDIPLARHSASLGVLRVLFFLCVHTLLTLAESRREKSFRRMSSPMMKTWDIRVGQNPEPCVLRKLFTYDSFTYPIVCSVHLIVSSASLCPTLPAPQAIAGYHRRILIAACRKLILAEACDAVVGRDVLVGVWRGR
jgi:hypothetical protein